MQEYIPFSYKGANFRICSDKFDIIAREIKNQRRILSDYIERNPAFLTALTPVTLLPEAPAIVEKMHKASHLTGVGPMAAVAGITAQIAAEAALSAGAGETIVENGGDIYLASKNKIVIGLFAGNSPLSGKLGLELSGKDMPLAVCSSSSIMGHSKSFGNCDLVTVTAKDAALADAAATHACNQVKTVDDIGPVLTLVSTITGIQGILIIKGDRIGISGNLPNLIKLSDQNFKSKITHDANSNFNPIFHNSSTMRKKSFI